MAKREIKTDKVFATKGPYVQGVEVTRGRVVYTSGFTARDRNGQVVAQGDIAGQTRQCLENIRAVFEAAGGGLRDLVKMTVFLRDPKDYEAMHAVRREMLHGVAFASSTVQAPLMNPDALVEIEAVAAIGD